MTTTETFEKLARGASATTTGADAPIRISPSQLNTYHGLCARRWWYDRNRPRVENKQAAYGTRVHGILEDWLQWGKPPDLSTPEGKTAVAGLGHIPPPFKALVEGSFAFDHDAITYNGRIDYADAYVARESVRVNDHKTIGDIRRAKTEAELLDDNQRIIYAEAAVRKYRVKSVTARWIYYQRVTKSRKSGRACFVEFTERAEAIRERFDDLHERKTLPVADAKRRGLTAPNLPRNLASCALFPPHGCPYREECHKGISPTDKANALEEALFG